MEENTYPEHQNAERKGTGRVKRKVKRKMLLGCLIPVVFLLLPLIFVVVMFGGMMTSAAESLVEDYKRAADLIGASWQEVLAFDTVRYDNELDDVNPYISTLEFMVVDYEEYEKVATEDGYIWVLARRGSLRTSDAIKGYFHCVDEGIGVNDILGAMNGYDQPKPYMFNLYSKSVETVMEEHGFSEEQQERMGVLILEGVLSEMFGADVPDFIGDAGNGLFAWPLPGIPESKASSSYGYRYHPVEHVWKFHYGTDIACPIGTPVISGEKGVVKSAGTNGGTAGTFITITHEVDGYTWTTKYFHLSEIKVSVGEHVPRGRVIALSGNTGGTTGPHLHVETLCNGVHQDPLPLITGH